MPSMNVNSLLDGDTLWRGHSPHHGPDRGMADRAARQPTGYAALDTVLPRGGWPDQALSEILFGADGVGEIRLLWPTLARLTQTGAGRPVVLIAPPYIPYAPAWQAAGIDLRHLQVVQAPNSTEALWAAEQCLRSGACSAVLCWPHKADDRALRRLQVAAQTGQALGFVFRDQRESRNPSPAALRLQISSELSGPKVRILKCRGGTPPANAIPLNPQSQPTLRVAAV